MKSIAQHIHLNLTPAQKMAIQKLDTFLQGSDKVFILRGYAGSGKTTLIKALVAFLKSEQKMYSLMAPTGRAAKILRQKVGKAETIHRIIYNMDEIKVLNSESKDVAEKSYHYYFPIKSCGPNQQILIVDEASMISSRKSEHDLITFGTDVLLDDLLTFAGLQTMNNKIIFVGDPAQLPPVGDNTSWAMEPEYFTKLKLQIDFYEMKDVVRQDEQSLILQNATMLRELIDNPKGKLLHFTTDDKTFIKLNPCETFDKYIESSLNSGIGSTVLIAYSNHQCYVNNLAIRDKLYPGQKEIIPGDLILINNNNYHTYEIELFNGDIATVVYVSPDIITQSAPVIIDENGKKTKRTISLQFREIKIRLPHYANDINCLIIESLLNSPNRDLSIAEMKALYINFVMRFQTEQKKNKEMGLLYYDEKSFEFTQQLKNDKFFNALRVKYAYSITCHKAQGGEWNKAFIDYYGRVGLSRDVLRWCYTATTRAIKFCYAINMPEITGFEKFKITEIIKITTIPNEALQLENIPLSPFHNHEQHPCKSLKYWNMREILENTPFQIKQIETINQFLERYTIEYNDCCFHIQASHKASGFFTEPFKVINKIAPDIAKQIEPLFNLPLKIDFNITYNPSNALLEKLFSIVQNACNDNDIKIINVVENLKQYYVNYYFQTDAICSFIQFYFNEKSKITYANPKSLIGKDDQKLQQLIQSILEYVV